ncbi:hypothetical protein GCM10027168_48380 [Streptomyces capparidis]
MSILAVHYSPDWNQELYQACLDRVIPDPDTPPTGLIAHYAAPREDGGWQVIDVWESADLHQRFLREKVIPAAQDIGAPPFDTKVTELYNALVPARRPHPA